MATDCGAATLRFPAVFVWKICERTPALGWKMGYLYSVVPISGVFVLAFSIEHLVGHRPAPPPPTEGGGLN